MVGPSPAPRRHLVEAAPQLLAAGGRALDRNDFHGAVNLLGRAHELSQTRGAELLLAYGDNHVVTIVIPEFIPVLEETGLPYEPHLVDILKNESHTPEFLSLNPNGKIPVLMVQGRGPIAESLGLEVFDFGVYQGWAPATEVTELREHRA